MFKLPFHLVIYFLFSFFFFCKRDTLFQYNVPPILKTFQWTAGGLPGQDGQTAAPVAAEVYKREHERARIPQPWMEVKPVQVHWRRGSSAIPPVPVRPTEPTNYKTITTIPLHTCVSITNYVIPLCNSKQSCFLSHRRNDQRRASSSKAYTEHNEM